jgi:hypothetical protein
MKKVFVSSLASALFAPLVAWSQSAVVTLQANSDPTRGAIIITNSVNIATNQLATVLARDNENGLGRGPQAYWVKDGITNSFPLYAVTPILPVVVAGPAFFVLSTASGNNDWGYCTIQIDPQAFPPGQTVVIPQGSGAYISLEASPDLRVWTNSVPGPYTNPAIANLFFRIRADRIP